MMLPLRLAWAWTMWKAQGQTFTGKIVMDLSDREREHGLTYVAFSRATKFENIGIEGGLSLACFTTSIREHSKMSARLAEEDRLRNLANATEERVRQWREDETITVSYKQFNVIANS